MFFLLLFILSEVKSYATPPSIPSGSYHLPYNTVQFVQHKPAKKGPILFPNDAPPPPPTPLIVTSRPLSESIARSELNPNNTLAAQSQYYQVTFKPDYLARGKNYKPFAYALATETPVYDFGTSNLAHADTPETVQESRKDDFYKDYEPERGLNARKTIFKDNVMSKDIKVWHSSLYSREANYYNIDDHDHENDNNDDDMDNDFDFEKVTQVVKPLYKLDNVHRQQNIADRIKYQDSPEQIYEGERDNSKEYNHGENYAFSYTVKDQKTGDDFSHSQQSTGTATNGEYRVRLPDGRMQIVSYTADENGYKADVRYDEHLNQDNSIDVEVNKDNRYRNNELPHKPYNANNYNDHVVNQNSFENEEYLRNRYNVNKKLLEPILVKRPTSYNNFRPVNKILVNPVSDFENTNNFGNKRDFQNYNDYQTKTTYVDTTKVRNNGHISDGLTDNNNDYLEHYNEQLIQSNDKVERAKDDDYYKFSDEVPLSKEIMDYSSELGLDYQPHKSKFSAFDPNQNEQAKVNLFENSRRNAELPIVSTVRPYEVTPVNVVAITPKKPNLYTNIKNIVPVTPTPFVYSTVSPSTPRNYLLSTIANLKHQINLANKPVLSQQYINKINKYLTYT